MVKLMDMANLSVKILMKEILCKDICTAKVFTHGEMVLSIKENLKIIKKRI